jgi:hypothetical protein
MINGGLEIGSVIDIIVISGKYNQGNQNYANATYDSPLG